MKEKIKNRYLLLIVASFIFFSLSAAEAKAAAPLIIAAGLAVIPLVLGLLKGLFSIGAFVLVAVAVNSLAGRLINLGISFQSILLDPERITVIQTIWTLVRDFINMFFILILLVIAFATIFNVSKYKASDLLPKLIIIAVLINFSLVITVWVIDLLWIPAAVFLGPLGGTISDRISNALNIQQFFSTQNISLITAELLKGGLPTGIFFREVIFRGAILIVNAFILSWIALIIWARIPVLIGLMLVSPIAWLGYTLPAIKKNSWDTWWQKLLCWGSIPIPLFGLIYFVVLFNQRLRLEISGEGSLSVILPVLGLTLGETLIWIITAGIFLAGMMYIKTLSCSMYGWVTLGFGKTWKGIRSGVGRAVDFGYTATGYKGATGQVQKELAQGGIPIFGKRMFGTAQREATEARREDQLRGALGLGSTYAAQRNLLDESGKETRDIDNRFKQARSIEEQNKIIDELGAKVEKGAKDPETLAAINALAKKGELDIALFNKAVDNFKDMPLALSKIFSEWKDGKFGGIKADDLLKIAKDNRVPLEAKRIAYSFLGTDDAKKVAEGMTLEDYEKGYEILGKKNTKEGRDFKKNIGKLKPTIVAQYNLNHIEEEIDKKEDRDKILTERPEDRLAAVILSQIEGAGAKDLGDYAKKEWDNPDFQKALDELIKTKEKRAAGSGRQYVQELRRRFIRESKDRQLEVLNSLGNVNIAESGSMPSDGKRTPDKIIIPPSAQFQLEKEEREARETEEEEEEEKKT